MVLQIVAKGMEESLLGREGTEKEQPYRRSLIDAAFDEIGFVIRPFALDDGSRFFERDEDCPACEGVSGYAAFGRNDGYPSGDGCCQRAFSAAVRAGDEPAFLRTVFP